MRTHKKGTCTTDISLTATWRKLSHFRQHDDDGPRKYKTDSDRRKRRKETDEEIANTVGAGNTRLSFGVYVTGEGILGFGVKKDSLLNKLLTSSSFLGVSVCVGV